MQAPTFLLVLVGGKVKWLLIGIVAAIALIVASLSVTAYGLRRDRAEFDAQVTADVQKSLVLPDNTAVREVRCQSGKLVAAELVLLPGYLIYPVHQTCSKTWWLAIMPKKGVEVAVQLPLFGDWQRTSYVPEVVHLTTQSVFTLELVDKPFIYHDGASIPFPSCRRGVAGIWVMPVRRVNEDKDLLLQWYVSKAGESHWIISIKSIGSNGVAGSAGGALVGTACTAAQAESGGA